MTDKILELILEKLDTLDQGQQDMKSEMQGMKSDIQGVKSEMQGMKSDIQDMRTRLDRIEDTVTRNHAATLEFYAKQMEFNTETTQTLESILGELEMHRSQISKNTTDIRKLKAAYAMHV